MTRRRADAPRLAVGLAILLGVLQPAADIHAEPPATRVLRVEPPDARLSARRPEMVIVFSAPMGGGDGLPYLQLLDAVGHEVHGAIRLPRGRPRWNASRTRYMLAFDPAPFVRTNGLAPSFTLLIDPRWPDARGRPLAVPFLRLFQLRRR